VKARHYGVTVSAKKSESQSTSDKNENINIKFERLFGAHKISNDY